MQPIGADDEVGVEMRTVVKGDPGGVADVGRRHEARAESQVHPSWQRLAQHVLEVGSHHVEQRAVGELGRPDRSASASPLVHQAGFLDVVCDLLDGGQQTHRRSGVVAGPEEVDHVALRSGSRRALQQHHVVAEG